uniref:Ribonuclease H-like domain-containing protein n=1 Tax=Tanacetum cinerariifolium TaxID=118510 RepID=A0A6L2KUJ0_TANCI|nr:ribonuclease H-like domain-containing protein [Tanacetum cinerariifolium]
MAKQAELTKSKNKVTGQRENRLVWNNVQRVNHQNKALKDKEIVDSGCSRHMTGNKPHLADYEEFKGGFVSFGGSNGRITGKGKIKDGRKESNTRPFVRPRQVLVTKPQNKTPYELLTCKQPIISYLRPFGCHLTILNTIDQLGKFYGKSDLWFLVEYFLNKHQANKSAGSKEANNSAGTQANDDQSANSKEIDLHKEHFILSIWSAYSTTVKSSGEKIEKNTDFKTCEKPLSQVEQIFLGELEKLKRQEKKANDAAESLRKEATHDI